MRNFFIIAFCMFLMLLFSGCKDENISSIIDKTRAEDVDNSAFITTSIPIMVPDEIDTSLETKVMIVENEQDELPYLFSIDLNYDGITEDFYVNSSLPCDEFKIVMYGDTEKNQKVSEIVIKRAEKLDIFKNDSTFNEGEDRYSFLCLSGGVDKSIHAWTVYTGGEHDRSFFTRGYSKDIRNVISCYQFNSSFWGDFDKLVTNPAQILKQYDYLDYVETINISKLANSGRTETYIKNITVCNGMKSISVSALENDPFGRKLKFTNGTCTYHSFDGEKVDVYKRKQKIAEPNGEYKGADIVETGEYEYLFCLKSPDNGTAELVYLGTPEESYIFAYECYMDDIENNVNFTLEKDRWEYVSTMDLKK